jgi:hypothetical protein
VLIRLQCKSAQLLLDKFQDGRTEPGSMIHGGAWMIGNSDGIPFNQVRYLLKHGIAVASVEYRFAPQ